MGTAATEPYRHTQPGTVIVRSLVAAMVLLTAMLVAAGFHPVALAVLVLLGLTAHLFRSLTVHVTDGLLTWWFGSGVFRNRVRLADVVEARTVKNRWYDGWGIHWTPRGWLYNVAGFDAVEIRLRSGRCIRIGTDEPDRLVDAVRHATGRHT